MLVSFRFLSVVCFLPQFGLSFDGICKTKLEAMSSGCLIWWPDNISFFKCFEKFLEDHHKVQCLAYVWSNRQFKLLLEIWWNFHQCVSVNFLLGSTFCCHIIMQILLLWKMFYISNKLASFDFHRYKMFLNINEFFAYEINKWDIKAS